MLDILRQELQSGRAVIIVGAGVSAQAAGLPGWRRALDTAITHLHAHGTAEEEAISELENRLRVANNTRDLVEVADSLQRLLIGDSPDSGEFAVWLQEVFDVPASSITNRSILRAIHQTKPKLLTTTNYDKLLSLSALGIDPVTWQDPGLLIRALRDGQRVVHLHGVWDRPETVIFGVGDYRRLVQSDAHLAFLRTLWLERTILFIGCSFDGMRDPDFVALLDWAAATFPHATHRHYALVRKDDYVPDQVNLFLNRWRIQLVPYGERYDDLAPFLESLEPPMHALVPSPPRDFLGRENARSALRAAIEDNRRVIVHGMGGIGKSSLVSKVVSELQTDNRAGEIVWISGKGKSFVDLYRELGSIVQVPGIEFLSDTEVRERVSFTLSQATSTTVIIDGELDSAALQEVSQSFPPSGSGLVVTARRRVTGFDQEIAVEPLGDSEAEELFGTLARVGRSEPLVGDICSLLEGHPLAISLAAGRRAVEDMPLERLRSRLTAEIGRLDLLLLPEQPESPTNSVRASLVVSLEDLPQDIEEVLSTIARFDADPSTELLASALGIEFSACEDLVGRLISRSLIQRTRQGTLHLHTLTRSAVLERTRENSEIYQRRVDAAINGLLNQLFESAERAPRRVIDDIDILVTFVNRSEASDPESKRIIAIGIVAALCSPHGLLHRYGLMPAYFATSRALTDKGVELARSMDNQEHIASMLHSKANVLSHARQHDQAIQILEEALNSVTALCNRSFLAAIKCQIGNNRLELYQYPAAEAAMRDGLADATEAQDREAIAQLTGQLGLVLLQSGQIQRAKAEYETAKELYAQHGDHVGVAACSYHLSSIAANEGHLDDAWSLQVESMEEDLAGENIMGALASLEQLASSVTNDEQLLDLLGRIDAVVDDLPTLTLLSLPKIRETLKARAYITAGNYEAAQSLLMDAIETPEQQQMYQSQAVCLGRLSEVALLREDLVTADKYNRRSRELYRQAGILQGVIICSHNGVSIALGRDDIDAAIDYGCEAIETAARLGDIASMASTAVLMGLNVFPRLGEPPVPLAPTGNHSFAEWMEIITSVAHERDLSRMIGAIAMATTMYGPGGTLHV